MIFRIRPRLRRQEAEPLKTAASADAPRPEAPRAKRSHELRALATQAAEEHGAGDQRREGQETLSPRAALRQPVAVDGPARRTENAAQSVHGPRRGHDDRQGPERGAARAAAR